MVQWIIGIVINGIFKLIGINIEKGGDGGKAEALDGRGKSIQESFEEQDKAREAAEKAKEEVEKQGNDDDVFGAEEYNNG
jgi:uncharacterized membrane protein YdbT with pleckstrin-like domain